MAEPQAQVEDRKRKSETSEEKNAFKELMQPKRQKQVIPGATTDAKIQTMERLRQRHRGTKALGMYLEDPGAFPRFRSVIYYNDDFVAVRDIYPKSSVHLLLLPRSEAHNLRHPVEVLNSDPEFLAKVREEATTLKRIVASELRRMYGEDSASEAKRTTALLGADDVAELPVGRDWEAGIKVGVHAIPSMNHLHIHVMSPDNVGGNMKKARHYLSFNTGFLVRLDEFPLPSSDLRLTGVTDSFSKLMVCWRCGESFGKGDKAFRVLKTHLQKEFEEWKKE